MRKSARKNQIVSLEGAVHEIPLLHTMVHGTVPKSDPDPKNLIRIQPVSETRHLCIFFSPENLTDALKIEQKNDQFTNQIESC